MVCPERGDAVNYNVVYTWQGEKYIACQRDTRQLAEIEAGRLRADGWNGVRVESTGIV